MRRMDWSGSSLGVPYTWQAELVFVTRLMLDSAFPAFVAWGGQLGFLYNDAYSHILGGKHPAALGRNFADVWAEIWTDVSPIVDVALSGRSAFYENLPLTVLRQDYPEQAWFTFSYSPVYLADGSVGGMHCTVIETTEQVRALQRQGFRVELAERLRVAASDGIIETATGMLGEFLQLDRVWYAEIDDAARTFLTRSMWTARELPALPERGSIDAFGTGLVDTLRVGETVAVSDIARDPALGPHATQYAGLGIASLVIVPLIKAGRLVINLNLAKATPHRWSAHELELAAYVAEYAWAMISRAQAEAAKWESELRYGTLIAIVDEGFAIVELVYDGSGVAQDYRFIEVNPAFEQQSGMHDVLGKTLLELIPDASSDWIALVARVAATGVAERIERQVESSGSWFSLYASRLSSTDRDRVAMLFSDISTRKSNEEFLRQSAAELSEANRRKTEFLATLAHELRNPLAPLRTGLEVLRMAPTPEARARVAAMMGRQITHMVRLIDDLLDIARISSGKVILQRELSDVAMLIMQAVETCTPQIQSNGHQLEIQLPPQPLLAYVDGVRIEQAVGNLLTNAAKYTPDGGHLALAVSRADEDVVIVVRDTGIGIAPEALQRVFDMFAQVEPGQERSRSGLGIGLALVQRIVAMHGGTVRAESVGIGQGSTFTIRLPLSAPRDDCADVGLAGGNAVGQLPRGSTATVVGRRILVADDNVDAAELLAQLLRMDGHDVEVANNGTQAFQAALRFAPEVAILDLGMPGMTGYEVAREMRAAPALASTIMIALTGWGAAGDRQRTLEAGFDYHLTKPVEHNALLLLLQAARPHLGTTPP